MASALRKWGNSVSVRIPSAVLAETRLAAGQPVNVRAEDGRIVVEPIARAKVDIEALIAGITPENLHPETDWGPPQGREVW